MYDGKRLTVFVSRMSSMLAKMTVTSFEDKSGSMLE